MWLCRCIRFGHTIPVANHVDVQISQAGPPSITHTWADFKFGQFSDWVNVFRPGSGDITVWEVRLLAYYFLDAVALSVSLTLRVSPLQTVDGTRGRQVLHVPHIPLTPGPLVVVIKVASSQVANASA